MGLAHRPSRPATAQEPSGLPGKPHDRYVAIGRVLVVPDRWRLGHDPLPGAGALFPGEELGMNLDALMADLDPRLVGVPREVVEPRRMLRLAAGRPDDEPA